MVKSRKNNLHIEVSNDVELDYETASTTSRRTKKGKGKALTKTKKIALKAKPKKASSFLVVNGKKIPLAISKKSRRSNISSKSKGVKKASSALPSKSAKRMALKKKNSQKANKKTSKVSLVLIKKTTASSKTARHGL